MQGMCTAAMAMAGPKLISSVPEPAASCCGNGNGNGNGYGLANSWVRRQSAAAAVAPSLFSLRRRPDCLVKRTHRSCDHTTVRRLRVDATSSVGSYDADGGKRPSDLETKEDLSLDPPQEKRKASLQAIAGVAAVVGVSTLVGVAVTLVNGGPAALMAAIAKSGFSAAFALIFVSEIGDKTFFIAALLAMRHSKVLVLLGASGALALMTVISVVIGRLCQSVPAQLQTTLPIGEYAAVALLIWFGIRSIKAAWDLPSEPAGTSEEASESGELAEAQEFLEKSEAKRAATPLEVVMEAFSLVFVAEWGDRSMLATVALGAAQSPWGVASGAIAGHVLATALAVLGGAFLSRYISEKVIGYTGGVLFLVFAAATLLGVF